ncbi:MAG: SUF system NifU family Fe-S cluster assembly protein [Candidatus Diapherotrites archaeon]
MSATSKEKEFAGDGIYREFILDHYHHPQHHGTLSHPSIHHREKNISCGDDISIQIKLDKSGRVEDARFTGSLCVISTASASLLLDAIRGKTPKEISLFSREDILKLLGITLGPTRLKCAMLPLDTIKNAFHIHHNYQGAKHA